MCQIEHIEFGDGGQLLADFSVPHTARFIRPCLCAYHGKPIDLGCGNQMEKKLQCCSPVFELTEHYPRNPTRK